MGKKMDKHNCLHTYAETQTTEYKVLEVHVRIPYKCIKKNENINFIFGGLNEYSSTSRVLLIIKFILTESSSCVYQLLTYTYALIKS